MMNQVIIVGRLFNEPQVKKLEKGKEVLNITVAVNRAFKNKDGEYETDFIDCVLWDGIAKNTNEYCHKGDVIGVKGRLEVDTYEKEDGTKEKNIHVLAEKVTFLSSKKDVDN